MIHDRREDRVERVATPGKVLVYAITKRHASEIARCFNEMHPSLGGRFAEAITTDSEDPQDAIMRYKRERYPRIAVSVGMPDTGFDCPEVMDIVFCRPTHSDVLYRQIRGRGTRLCAGKEFFLVLDFMLPYYLRVLGDSEVLQMGYGYWVKVDMDVVWTVHIQ